MGEMEKLAMEGLLNRKRRELDATETKVERCCKEISYYSFPMIGSLDTIEPDKVLQAAEELKRLMDERKRLQEEIHKLEREI